MKAGQIIAKLNSQEFEKRLAELQAALGVNAARLALAERELARSKKLAATGVATRKELEQASADAAVLRAEAVKLQAAIQTVEWQIQQTAVRAPVDGVLFERLVNAGNYIYSDSNREIASICDPAKLQIWVNVNQRDVARLRVGQAGGGHSRCGARQGFYRGGFANSASRIALEEYDPGKDPSQ